MNEDENQSASCPLLQYHYHTGDGWEVHTEEVSITVKGEKVIFEGSVYDPWGMVYDAQTNESDWASVVLSPDEFIEGLTRVQLGEVWEHEQLRFANISLLVGNRSLSSPGPARATLSDERRTLLFLDAHDAVFSTLEQARTGTRLPARQIDKLFLESVRKYPQHVARLGTVGLERTVHALLQEAHLSSEIRMRPIVEAIGLYLVEAVGEDRGTMLLEVRPDASEKVGIHVVDRINGVRDRYMVTKAVIMTRSSFTDDVFHRYAGHQDRIELVDYDRLTGTLTDAGWMSYAPGFLMLPVADQPIGKVFISYRHSNRDFANWLYNHVLGWGYDCYVDQLNLRAGEVILSAVQQAISGSDAVLLCCSQGALKSPWVRAEIKRAMEREKVENETIIIPLDLDGALSTINTVPGVPDYMLALHERLAIDFQGWDASKLFGLELTKIRKSLEQLNRQRSANLANE